MRRSPALALAVFAALGACEEAGPQIDPFPIPANRVNGPLRVGLETINSGQVVALLDTNSPLTVIDGGGAAGQEQLRRRRTDISILAACGGDNPLAGCETVERARYEQVPVLVTHPCLGSTDACRVGLGSPTEPPMCPATAGPETVGYGAILGADLLSRSAVRLDLRDDDAPAIRLFPDIAGDREFYSETGVAVLSTSFTGGATISIEGGEVVYTGNRIPINSCADFMQDDYSRPSGAALLLLLSTAIGPTVISESAYERYYNRVTAVCEASAVCGPDAKEVPVPIPYAELPEQCLWLPSGPTVARIATMRRLAITGNSARARGPCEERRAARIMYCNGKCGPGDICPCAGSDPSCAADAAVALEPSDGITVAVLRDAHPLLQSLREELRPAFADVDGLLGLDALHDLTLDIDYPNARLLVACEQPPSMPTSTQCAAYPETLAANSTMDDTMPPARCQ